MFFPLYKKRFPLWSIGMTSDTWYKIATNATSFPSFAAVIRKLDAVSQSPLDSLLAYEIRAFFGQFHVSLVIELFLAHCTWYVHKIQYELCSRGGQEVDARYG